MGSEVVEDFHPCKYIVVPPGSILDCTSYSGMIFDTLVSMERLYIQLYYIEFFGDTMAGVME